MTINIYLKLCHNCQTPECIESADCFGDQRCVDDDDGKK